MPDSADSSDSTAFEDAALNKADIRESPPEAASDADASSDAETIVATSGAGQGERKVRLFIDSRTDRVASKGSPVSSSN
jgi:hypothetical protein